MKRRSSRKILTSGLILAVAGLLVLNFDSLRRLYYGVSHEPLILKYSKENELDPYLVAALIYSESGFQSDARSDVGARGLMQLMPETAKEVATGLGVKDFKVNDLFIPEPNIRYGTNYLARLLDRFQDPEDALAAYNAGPTLVAEWKESGKEIPFPETRSYVDKVMKTKVELRSLYPEWSAINAQR